MSTLSSTRGVYELIDATRWLVTYYTMWHVSRPTPKGGLGLGMQGWHVLDQPIEAVCYGTDDHQRSDH